MIYYTFFEVKLPEVLVTSWSREITNISKIFLFFCIFIFSLSGSFLYLFLSFNWFSGFLIYLFTCLILFYINLSVSVFRFSLGSFTFCLLSFCGYNWSIFGFNSFFLFFLLFSFFFSRFFFLFFCQSFFVLYGLLSFIFTEKITNSNLSFIIASKAVHTSRFQQSNWMMFSSSHLNDMITFMRIQISNSLCICNRIFVAKTKLSVIIHAPGEYLICVIDIERMEPSTEYILSIFSVSLFNFEGLFVLVSGFEFAANFTWFSITPSVYLFAFS